MEPFRVIVGNIGTVYAGNNYMKAMAVFASYKKHEPTHGALLLHDGKIEREYIGNGGESTERLAR